MENKTYIMLNYTNKNITNLVELDILVDEFSELTENLSHSMAKEVSTK